jgi:hypothetical protein
MSNDNTDEYGLSFQAIDSGDDESQNDKKVADEVADKVADEVADKVADEVADKVADEVADKVADKVADEVADKVADEEIECKNDDIVLRVSKNKIIYAPVFCNTDLPKDGWIQGCIICNIKTAKVTYYIDINDRYIYYMVYCCSDCKIKVNNDDRSRDIYEEIIYEYIQIYKDIIYEKAEILRNNAKAQAEAEAEEAEAEEAEADKDDM